MSRPNLRAWNRLIRRIRLEPDQVLFFTRVPMGVLVARLGEGSPIVSGGYGGWEDLARPGRPAATRFAGSGSARQLQIPLVLGSWPAGQGFFGPIDCETSIGALESLGRQLPSAERGAHPPVLKLRGAVPHGDLLWVIDDIQWGDAIVRADTRRRAQALATVVLRQYVRPDLVTVVPRGIPARRRRRPAATRPYRVRRGDTLEKIARALGAESRAEVAAGKRRILALNRERDPKRLLSRRTIKVPRTL